MRDPENTKHSHHKHTAAAAAAAARASSPGCCAKAHLAYRSGAHAVNIFSSSNVCTKLQRVICLLPLLGNCKECLKNDQGEKMGVRRVKTNKEVFINEAPVTAFTWRSNN